MLQVERLTVTYGARPALSQVSLEAARGEIVAVMGESGSGKSTLLRAIAGLIDVAAGKITWQGTDMTGVPTHQRNFGLMFQDYALFPHLNVRANVAFGLRMQRVGDDERRTRVDQLLDLVGLGGYGERDVAGLSGGEQQRVALARTLAPQPSLVLLDEPLGALDRARRDQLLGDMQRIFSHLEVATVYVTHDHHEAFAVADRVAVLEQGAKIADGAPGDLWADPRHAGVATLLGFPVLRDVTVRDRVADIDGSGMPVEIADGIHSLALLPGAVRVTPDGEVAARIVATRFEGGTRKAVVEIRGVEALAEVEEGTKLGPGRVAIDVAGVRLVHTAVS